MLDNSGSLTFRPIALTEDTAISQRFENTAEEIKDLQLYLGNYGRMNEATMEISLIEEESSTVVFKDTVSLVSIDQDNSWYPIVKETINVIPGKIYRVDIKSEADLDNCIAVYAGDVYNKKNRIEINGIAQEGALALKLKGKTES